MYVKIILVDEKKVFIRLIRLFGLQTRRSAMQQFISSIISTMDTRVVFPNLGNLALTSSFSKYRFLKAKNSLATIVKELSVLICFSFRSMPTASTKSIHLK